MAPEGATPTEAAEIAAPEAPSSEAVQQQEQQAPEGSSTSDLQARYERAVAEAIAERKKRQQAEARVSEFEKAAMTEGERKAAEAADARAEAEAARAELRRTRVEYAVRAKAAEMGVVDPEAAFRLLDTGSLEPDDPALLGKQVEAALTDLVRQKPYLRGTTNATSPTNGQTRVAASAITPESLRGMSEAEIAALWRERPDEVLAALKQK